jgi:quercetin dioxygenase-like cupin family protein
MAASEPAAGRSTARPTVQIDNDAVRVTEWSFAPGATTGFHRHEYDYVVVPMATGRLRILAGGDESLAELVTGQAYYRPAGVEHEVVNANDGAFTFVEVELKDRGLGPA